MTKAEFLGTLRRRLEQMPAEELEKQLAYYEELFHDMTEDGMSEEEAAAHLGDPNQIAGELLSELPLAQLVKSRVKPSGGWTALSIVLLVLGSPLWASLLLAVAAVVFSLILSLWAVAFSFGAAVLAIGLTAAYLFLAAVFGYLSVPALLLVGLALLFGGVSIPGALLLIALCRGLGRFCAWLFRQIKSLFIKKEG